MVFGVVAGLAAVGCSRGPDERAAINETYLSILAAGIAREAAGLVPGEKGEIIGIVADRPGMAPRNNEFLEAFVRRARSAGFSLVRPIRLTFEESGTTTVPGEVYARVLEEHGNASAIVWMCTTPPDTSGAHARKGKNARVVVAIEDSPAPDFASRLLERHAADVVIEPRGHIGPDAGKGARDPLKAFDELFDVKR